MIAGDPRTAAEAHFTRGLGLAATPGGWESALHEFLESRRLFPTRSATRNAAIAFQALGRFTEALELYDSLLRDFSTIVSEAELDGYRRERRALLLHFGELVVELGEPGVSVVVDGRQRGVTPLAEPLPLEAGTHVVHFNKEGFEPVDEAVLVSSGSRQTVEVVLRPLAGARVLAVDEAGGGVFDVVVDAATVGETPWRGMVSAGLHSVLLRGDHRGTAPKSVDLAARPDVALTLQAVTLDAEASIDPTPTRSTVYVDGEFAGYGPWQGALPSGAHRVDVIAPGHLPFRRDVALKPNARTVIVARLATNVRMAPTRSRFYVGGDTGLLFAHTLRGNIGAACDSCDRVRPFGWRASGRVGYMVVKHLAPELELGYLSLIERGTLSVQAGSEPGTFDFRSTNEREAVHAAGPFAALGAAAHFWRRTPLTARLRAGLALLRVSATNQGTFNGNVTDTSTGAVSRVQGDLSVGESPVTRVIPFVSTELRFGYAFTSRLSVDLGVSLELFLPPDKSYTDRAGLLTGRDRFNAGVLILPDESVMRSFVAVSPSIALRFAL